MLKIYHRINSNYKLSKIDEKYGVEIDIRSFKESLIVGHEPFKKKYFLKQLFEKF